MSAGKRGRRQKIRRSDANFQDAEQDKQDEYGRTGRYKPSGPMNSPGRKSGKPFSKIRLRVVNA